MLSIEDRLLGCLVGGSIGDALGGPHEGQAPPIVLKPDAQDWRLSDDTQLTLATCEAIVEAGRPAPEAIARSFVEWFKAGRITGIGASTLKSLRDLEAGNHWALAGCRGEKAAGNGAAMRVSPLAFFLDHESDEDRATLRDVCRITHHNDEAYAGALAILTAVRLAILGRWRGDGKLLPMVVESLPDTRVRDAIQEIAAVDSGTSIREAASRTGTSGYVVESVPLALLGAEKISSLGFADMLGQLIETGGDTDTIAAMAGNIAGGCMGFNALPTDLVNRVPDLDAVRTLGRKLSRLVMPSRLGGDE